VGLDEELKILDAKHVRHLIRYSGTENKLRVLLECKEYKVLNECTNDMLNFFQKALNV